MRTHLLVPLLVATLAAGSLMADEPPAVPALPPSVLSHLETAAREAAKAGDAAAVSDLVDEALRLGLDMKRAQRLNKTCSAALAKARKGVRPAPRAAAAIERAVRVMEKTFADPSLEDAARRALAERIVRLDASVAAAQERLGRTEVGGVWLDDEGLRRLEGRRVVQDVLRRARALEIELELSVADDPLMVEILGRPGARAQFGPVALVSHWNEEKAARVLREALRTAAVVNWAMTGELAVPQLGKMVVHTYATKDQYLASVELAGERRLIPQDDLQYARQLEGWSNWGSGIGLFREVVEVTCTQDVCIRVLDAARAWSTGEKVQFWYVQPCLKAAVLNWVFLAYLGNGMPNLAFVESKEGRGERAHASREGARGVEVAAREEALVLADAGLVGCRSWIRYLAERGEDPPWTEAMLDEIGRVRGDPLFKTTSVFEYLLAGGPVGSLAAATRRSGVETPAETGARFEEALGRPLAEVERAWRRWLLGGDPGLVARLSGEVEPPRKPTSPEKKAVEYLATLRDRALDGWSPNGPLGLHAPLSDGAALHGRYLAVHEDQQAAWPDCHEEYPDRELFSVEGAWAGLHSVIAPGVTDPVEAIDAWMATFYHRLPLIAHDLVRIGYAAEGGTAVLDCTSLAYGRRFDIFGELRGGAKSVLSTAVVWPAADAKGLPTRFAPEMPNPVPGEDQGRFGYPITLQMRNAYRDANLALTLTLHEGGVKGPVVDGFFSTPEEPTNPILAPDLAWCLIPKTHLKKGATYTVVADLTVTPDEGASRPAKRVWSFRT